MTAEAREFDLADILSITTGILLSHQGMRGIYTILGHLTGDDSLMTHQLPRAAQACRPALLEQHPQLASATIAEDTPVPELLAWLTQAEATYGATLPVTPLAAWEHRNPIAELVEMIGPERVIPVVLPDRED